MTLSLTLEFDLSLQRGQVVAREKWQLSLLITSLTKPWLLSPFTWILVGPFLGVVVKQGHATSSHLCDCIETLKRKSLSHTVTHLRGHWPSICCMFWVVIMSPILSRESDYTRSSNRHVKKFRKLHVEKKETRESPAVLDGSIYS